MNNKLKKRREEKMELNHAINEGTATIGMILDTYQVKACDDFNDTDMAIDVAEILTSRSRDVTKEMHFDLHCWLESAKSVTFESGAKVEFDYNEEEETLYARVYNPDGKKVAEFEKNY